MTSQNLLKQMDLTGLTVVTASEIMQLVETALPASDKGFIIVTTDTEANVPDVPDPTQGELEGVDVAFWERFIWVRRPHASLGSAGRVKLYAWHPTGEEDETLLLWTSLDDIMVEIEEELATLQETVSNLAAEVQNLGTGVTNANNNANNAVTTVTTLSTTVTTLQNNLVALTTLVDTINATVTALSTDLATPIAVAKGGTGAGTVKLARTNLGLSMATAGFATIKDIKATGTGGGAVVGGAWTVRDLNTGHTIGSPGLTLNGDNTFDLTAGTYIIEAECPAYDCNQHQARLWNVTDGSVAILGGSCSIDIDFNGQNHAKIMGIVTVAATTKFRIEHKLTANTGDNSLGYPTGFDSEVYTQVKITKIVEQ